MARCPQPEEKNTNKILGFLDLSGCVCGVGMAKGNSRLAKRKTEKTKILQRFSILAFIQNLHAIHASEKNLNGNLRTKKGLQKNK